MKFEHTSPRLESTDVPWRQINGDEQLAGTRYAHIVVPTTLALDDRPALMLGMEMAANHRAKLTVLYVVPLFKDEPEVSGLDAFSLLHRVLVRTIPQATSPKGSDHSERARSQVKEFIKDVVPERLRNNVRLFVEYRKGSVEDTILLFAEEATADVVIVSTGATRWWLPILPARVRRLLQHARQQVILVRSDVRSHTSQHNDMPLVSPVH